MTSRSYVSLDLIRFDSYAKLKYMLVLTLFPLFSQDEYRVFFTETEKKVQSLTPNPADSLCPAINWL